MTRFAALPLLALLLSCATPAPAPEPAPIAVKDPEVPKLERLDMDLVRRVDAAIQARFATLTESDLKTRRFGLTRMGPRDVAHPLRFEPEADSDREMVARLSTAGWRGAIYTISDGHWNSSGVVKGPVSLGTARWERAGNQETLRRLGARCLLERCPVQGQDGDVLLEARPVLASQKLCLKCHPGAKQVGDPVAAVVYAFVKDRAWVPSSGE
jgi:hypothetical protein